MGPQEKEETASQGGPPGEKWKQATRLAPTICFDGWIR